MSLKSDVEWSPSKKHRMAKARLRKHLDENDATVSIEDLNVEAMSVISKAENLHRWFASSPEFGKWWYDRDVLSTSVAAYAEIAIERLHEILTSPIESGREALVSTKDVLAAARLMLELADAFPKKSTKVEFADAAIGKMQDEEVDRELEAMKSKLKLTGVVDVTKT